MKACANCDTACVPVFHTPAFPFSTFSRLPRSVSSVGSPRSVPHTAGCTVTTYSYHQASHATIQEVRARIVSMLPSSPMDSSSFGVGV